ncbi:hypothetical protein M413DRAFT_13424 [Hebeloma cylindrosporum]|uniref:Ubiquitin-like protease family profile domain-containing protein n=1 Tax=Hebeloma cylindrosporum TaxID=76867 RepID=A0A0C2XH98_HEBCY|nr:hypothetical protein M413DRAFT_13424 [Hebeloma cylindrosporum h7]
MSTGNKRIAKSWWLCNHSYNCHRPYGSRSKQKDLGHIYIVSPNRDASGWHKHCTLHQCGENPCHQGEEKTRPTYDQMIKYAGLLHAGFQGGKERDKGLTELFIHIWHKVYPNEPCPLDNGAPRDLSQDDRYPGGPGTSIGQPGASSSFAGPTPSSSTQVPPLPPLAPSSGGSFHIPPASVPPSGSSTSLSFPCPPPLAQPRSLSIPPRSQASLDQGAVEQDPMVAYLRQHRFPVEVRAAFSAIVGGLVPGVERIVPRRPVRVLLVENPEHYIIDGSPGAFLSEASLHPAAFERIIEAFPRSVRRIETDSPGDIKCLIPSWIFLATEMMEHKEKWAVTLMSWTDYSAIMVQGVDGPKFRAFPSLFDLVVGGLNYDGDFINPKGPYGLDWDKAVRYHESSLLLAETLTIWPNPRDMLTVGQKLQTQRLLIKCAAALDFNHPTLVPISEGDLESVAGEIQDGAVEGVLKRTQSAWSNHLITKYTKDPKKKVKKALREQKKNWLCSTGEFTEPLWFLQPYLPALMHLGELRTFLIDGALYYTVYTTPEAFDPQVLDRTPGNLPRPLHAFAYDPKDPTSPNTTGWLVLQATDDPDPAHFIVRDSFEKFVLDMMGLMVLAEEKSSGVVSGLRMFGRLLLEASRSYQESQSQGLHSAVYSSRTSLHGGSESDQQHQRCPSLSLSGSSSDYRGDSLVEASREASGRWAPNMTTNAGLTSPDDVSLDGGESPSFDVLGGNARNPYSTHPAFPPTASRERPVLPNVRESMRDRRSQAPDSSSEEEDVDVYEPPEREEADALSGDPANEDPPPLHIIGESCSYLLKQALPTLLDLYRMDPRVWEPALEQLPTLKAKGWIEGVLIDMWLLDMWRTRYRQTPFRFIPTQFIQIAQMMAPHAEDSERERGEVLKQIKTFRRYFDDLPQSEHESCALEDSICVLNTGGNHYCTVIFMPETRRIHVLGRQYSTIRRSKGSKDWDTWGGPRIWAWVCKLYGWSQDQVRGMSVNSVDWHRNGYDCGPTACQIVEGIWVGGLPLDGEGIWKGPNLPCCHTQRLNMAIEVNQLAVDGHRKFLAAVYDRPRQIMEYLDDRLDGFVEAAETIQQRLSEHPGYALKPVEENLRSAILRCASCRRTVDRVSERPFPPKNVHVPRKSPSNATENLARIDELLHGTRSKYDLVMDTYEEESPLLEELSALDLPECKDHSSSESELDSEDMDNRHSTGAFQVADWEEGTVGRFPRPKGPPIPGLKTLRGLRHRFSDDYDDYTDGPTLDVLDPIPDTVIQLAQLSLVYIANQVITTPWTLFKDYGYRLLPDFLQMFWLTKPILVREHLAPVGLRDPPAAFLFHHPRTKTRRGDAIVTDDRIVLGAQQLLDMATEEESDLALLTGRTLDGSYIYVDLEVDSVPLEPKDLTKACDIDSLIWITRDPRFIGSIGIYDMPVIRNKPPIWKNNGVMVELLFPQSEDDKYGSRTQWQAKKFRLSRLPHLAFGVLNQTTATVEILLFFPRMTHQHPHTGRWQNGIPKDVQDFFWDRVLLPAMANIALSVQEPYRTADREHTAFKQKGTTGKNLGQSPPKHAWHTSELTKLIDAMNEIIQSNEALDHFGSFFFVIQVKGSKGLSQVPGEGGNLNSSLRGAVDRFRESFPGLDWPYMMKRKNGELICDVGVTIQPKRELGPLVGLWRLDCLDASYGAAGFLAGKMHTLNTFALYGGLQADSPEARCLRTHVVLRQSYNLAYEATRQRDNSRNLFNEKDVYCRNKTFHRDLAGVRDIYRHKAPGISYGVRDEFRVGGEALEQMMECMDDMVDTFLNTNPILWISSAVWFHFLDRRLGILADSHAKLYFLRPPNYGVLSGLFANLMQSVMFTPPVVHTFVKESLASLEYKRHCASDGMFFLHTFDIDKKPCVEGILERDDSSIQRFLGGGPRKPGARWVREAAGEEDGEGEGSYPLGRTPTWSQIKLSLQRNPFELMPKWIFPVELVPYIEAENGSMERLACKIFIKFCRALWIILHPAWMLAGNVAHQAKNIGRSSSELVSGRPMLSFDARWEIYFPDEGVALKKRWEIFKEESGYLHLYHAEARRLGTNDTRELNRCLGFLLSHCQCLPDSDLPEARDNIWRPAQQQMVLLANPRYYLIAGVGSTMGRGNRAQRAPAGHRALRDAQQQFLMQEGFDATLSAKAVRMKAASVRNMNRRSNKGKNARKPPKRKNQKQVDPSSSSSKEGDTQRYQPEDHSNDGEDGDGEDDTRQKSTNRKRAPKTPIKDQIPPSEEEELSDEEDEEVESAEGERGTTQYDNDLENTREHSANHWETFEERLIDNLGTFGPRKHRGQFSFDEPWMIV